MSNKSRPSVQKRQRESRRNERKQLKAEKAAARREQKLTGTSPEPSVEVPETPAPAEPNADDQPGHP